jgi:transcriptional regulator of acetoin/glycerol metabolism
MRRYEPEHFKLQSDHPYPGSTLPKGVEADVNCAARSGAPVLITATPDDALEIALVIASRSSGKCPPSVLVCDASGGDDVVECMTDADRSLNGVDRSPLLLFREVQNLGAAEQKAVFDRLIDPRERRSRSSARILASSSVDLYEQVTRGAFDERLFYRLNAIHIIAPTG